MATYYYYFTTNGSYTISNNQKKWSRNTVLQVSAESEYEAIDIAESYGIWELLYDEYQWGELSESDINAMFPGGIVKHV